MPDPNCLFCRIVAKQIPSAIVYEDDDLMVVDKPAGMVPHPAHGSTSGTLVNALLAHVNLPGDSLRPGLVHRLDRDTSGCLVLGRHHKALEKLGLLFKQGKISKTYWAVVDGVPEADEGLIDLPLGRLDASRGWWMKVDPLGQASRTRYTVLGRAEGRAFLALEPLTGRTHQLRVHCAALGWPILGDPIYGTGTLSAPSLHLHARSISVPLYKNKDAIAVEAPVPAHMTATLAAFEAGDQKRLSE